MRCGASSAARRPGPVCAPSSMAQLPRCRSPSTSTVWRWADNAEMPGEVGRQRGRADAAAHARHGDHSAAAHRGLRRILPAEQRPEMAGHHVGRQRLEQIFQHAEVAGQSAIEAHLLPIAHYQHPDIGLDHVRQVFERAQRILAGHVNDQGARRGRLLQRGDGGANAAAAKIDAPGGDLDQRLAQHAFGFGVGDEADDGRAIRTRRLLLARGLARATSSDISFPPPMPRCPRRPEPPWR